MEMTDTPIEEVKVSLQMPEPVCSGKYCCPVSQSHILTEQKVKDLSNESVMGIFGLIKGMLKHELLEEVKTLIKKEIKHSKQPKEPKQPKDPKDVKVITTQCKLTPYGESVVTISKEDMDAIQAERKKFKKSKSKACSTEEPKKHEPLKNRVKKLAKVEVVAPVVPVVPVVEVKEQKKRGRPKKIVTDLKADNLKIG